MSTPSAHPAAPPAKKKWSVIGAVHASKYLGTVEAETREEAEALAEKLDQGVSMCHQCATECEDPEIVGLMIDEEI